MMDLVTHINNEKEIFFDIVNGNKKDSDKNENKDNNLKMNI